MESLSIMTNPSANPFRLRRVERMQDEEVARTYCQPKLGVNLSDGRHIILQGPRGSGKSTILKALTTILPRTPAQSSVNPPIVGTYINVGQPWVAAFQRKGWLDKQVLVTLFTQAFNLLVCSRIAETLSKLSNVLFHEDTEGKFRFENQCAKRLGAKFFHGIAKNENTKALTLLDLADLAEDTQYELRDRAVRALFGEKPSLPANLIASDIFEPISGAIPQLMRVHDQLARSIWIFAFDELDNLSEDQQLLFNTVIRNSSHPITIKGACLPHGHKTLETLAHKNPVLPGEDFDYVALSLDPKSRECALFCLDLYQTRTKAMGQSGLPPNPVRWLGNTSLRERARPLLEKKHKTTKWTPVVRKMLGGRPEASESGDASINEDSLRQHIPTLAIRLIKRAARGNSGDIAYAGWEDIVAASDGNPRRLLRLLDRMYEVHKNSESTQLPIEKQSTIIRSIADGAFGRLISLPRCGKSVQHLVDGIGRRLEDRIHNSPYLQADACSIAIDLGALPPSQRESIETAIAYGVLFPWRFDSRSGYPRGMQNYWLSFGLGPRYNLLLRKGRSLTLSELMQQEWSSDQGRFDFIDAISPPSNHNENDDE
jgi:energy-coupling factor transporter ATP-binding protein EcfA2